MLLLLLHATNLLLLLLLLQTFTETDTWCSMLTGIPRSLVAPEGPADSSGKPHN